MSCKCKVVMRGLLKPWWQQSWIPVIYTRFLLIPFSLRLFIILPWFTSSEEIWHRLLYTKRLNASWDGLFPSFRATRRLELLMIWYLLTFHCKSLLLAQWGCSVVKSDQHRPIYLLASPALGAIMEFAVAVMPYIWFCCLKSHNFDLQQHWELL